MPKVLRHFKETGNTDYAIDSTMLTQVMLRYIRAGYIRADFLFSGVQMCQGGALSDEHYPTASKL